eukprot:COSAG03_NODE_11736_length_578_cov_0.987474_2_plen_71_part_01
MAKFSPIEFDHNEFGWGPTSAPELFTDVYVTHTLNPLTLSLPHFLLLSCPMSPSPSVCLSVSLPPSLPPFP